MHARLSSTRTCLCSWVPARPCLHLIIARTQHASPVEAIPLRQCSSAAWPPPLKKGKHHGGHRLSRANSMADPGHCRASRPGSTGNAECVGPRLQAAALAAVSLADALLPGASQPRVAMQRSNVQLPHGQRRGGHCVPALPRGRPTPRSAAPPRRAPETPPNGSMTQA
eukprot:352498-Chlamydomonas_euryale.AAC.2